MVREFDLIRLGTGSSRRASRQGRLRRFLALNVLWLLVSLCFLHWCLPSLSFSPLVDQGNLIDY